MSALNQDNARLRLAVNTAGTPPIGSTTQPLGSQGDDESSCTRRRSTIASDLRRELAAATEVERLKAKIADVMAAAATREQELSAQLEAQRRSRSELEYRLGGVDIKMVQRDTTELRQQQSFFAEQVS